MWHNILPLVKYAPLLRQKASKVKEYDKSSSHSLYYAYEKRVQSDFMEGIYCKNYQKGSLKRPSLQL